MRLNCEPQLRLEACGYRATLLPSAGGRVGSLSWHGAGHWHDLLVPIEDKHFDEHQWPKAGAFAMLPFANRLPPEGFCFRDRQVKPSPGPQGFAMHGFMHRQPWDVVTASADSAELRCTHAGQAQGWPWAFMATQHVRLGAGGLSVAITLTNLSSEPMPFGAGWHPYHPRAGAQGLAFSASRRHPLGADGRACAPGLAAVTDLAAGETVAFEGWQRQALLGLAPQLRVRIGGEGWDKLVLHRPASQGYVCVEPVTTLPGSLGLAGSPVIAPDESCRVRWSCAGQEAAV